MLEIMAVSQSTVDSTMKTILCALITLPLGLAVAAPESWMANIQTLQGRSYKQCKIVQRDPEGVTFTHQKGTARLLFSELPESTRYQLGYSPKAAADLEKSRAQARQEKAAAQRLNQQRAEELRQAARVAELKRLSQQPIIIYPQFGQPFAGPVPAVGFASTGYGYGQPRPWKRWQYHPHIRGWDGVGIANIGAGSGGVYVPQSGGFVFTGLPQVHYSPTLGYYNPGQNSAVRSNGHFGHVPGLAAPNPPAVVPGVSIRGSATLPAGR